MKKILIFIVLTLFCNILTQAQDLYWVFFTDKSDTQFNPYEYFDTKALERRTQLGISLYDISDYPLNDGYVQAVENLSEEVIGASRWFNALAVSTFRIDEIRLLPFVKNTQIIEYHGNTTKQNIIQLGENGNGTAPLSEQLTLMQGELFVENGLDGKGIRIAVLDGGFRMADTHPAFQHLRDNHQIIKTYNFPLKKENVYGWDSHGTMVLSCIAGIGKNGEPLGLATGAEFLLARTETSLEQKKEEVWWLMGMEWADANGANIINSSLGYGKDRYNPEDMDGTSLVARAANMAAKKGILVCNSMGNEADDNSWKTNITPADADSVLSVGGVERNGQPSFFTSLGPTADGRRKPNVSALGTNVEVANPSASNLYTRASGTSFASPLTAGFAACAWQSHRSWNNMQLRDAIEKSADMYPYYDYQYGYGVPQAGYFVGKEKESMSPTFSFEESGEAVFIVVPDELADGSLLHYQLTDSTGRIESYKTLIITGKERIIPVNKTAKGWKNGQILRVCYRGYTDEYRKNKQEISTFAQEINTKNLRWTVVESHSSAMDRASNWGANGRYNLVPYVTWGFAIPSDKNKEWGNVNYGNSESLSFGLRFKGNICKWYSLGLGVEIGANWYNLSRPAYELKDKEHNTIGVYEEQQLCNVRLSTLSLEFYQRFRLVPGGLFGYGIYVDAGIYGGWNFWLRQKFVSNNDYTVNQRISRDEYSPLQWGVRARIGFDIVAIYAQYRISAIDKTQAAGDLPKLEIGLQATIPLGR